MKIVLIGAGNLAVNLAKSLVFAGHDIIQVYSKTAKSAGSLAKMIGCMPVTDISSVAYDADLYIISVKDCVISSLISELCKGREERIFLHTAGSIDIDVFKTYASHYGVLYPMQTFSKQREVSFSDIPCFIEANDDIADNAIKSLACSISNDVRHLSFADRRFLHLSAVFACNFVNHCYTMAADILKSRDIPFEVLLPLIDETASKVHDIPPFEAQTGPAVRYDSNVIEAQMQLLENKPALKELYDIISRNIHDEHIKDKQIFS